MSNILEHLGKDTLPNDLVERFVHWCIWEQARPALVRVLTETGLKHHAEAIAQAEDLNALAALSHKAGQAAEEARRSTGPLGLSTAQAASFLVSRLVQSASEADYDPEGVAFFTAQVCGWAGFADGAFSDPALKNEAEAQARREQEAHLTQLWQSYSRHA